MRTVSAEEAVSVIKSGGRVFVHSVAAAPRRLVEAMTARAPDLRVVEVVHLHTEVPEFSFTLARFLSPRTWRCPTVRTIHNAVFWADWAGPRRLGAHNPVPWYRR